jgi:hypothetical protein
MRGLVQSPDRDDIDDSIDDCDLEVMDERVCSQECCERRRMPADRAAAARSGDQNVGQNIGRSGV